MNARLSFYRRVVAGWIPDRGASVLVVAGGGNDAEVFSSLGFAGVTLSNVEAPPPAADLRGYRWSAEDAEALRFPDASFDYAVVHAGLHHCRSPHRALLEMYRVARRAAIGIEPADNALVRAMQAFGFAQVYECAAVRCHGGRDGGVGNTCVPNFIYRWTRREVEKTIRSHNPAARHRFRYAHGTDAPASEFTGRSRLRRAIVRAAMPFYALAAAALPAQRNLFAFMVEKPQLPRDLQPWLRMEGGQIKFGAS